MICYICQKEITTGFYWAPCPKIGVYAAICRECHQKNIEEAKKIREEASA